MREERSERIVSMEQAGEFRVAEGQPDVRGWEVVAADGRRIGEVDDLLVDTGAMKVRYLEVDLDARDLGLPEERTVLVPIGYARLEREGSRVRVEEITSADLAEYPAYGGQGVTRSHEAELRGRFERGYEAGSSEADFYEGPHYDSSRFYGA
jgi:photosynthetic reaction center H subunit